MLPEPHRARVFRLALRGLRAQSLRAALGGLGVAIGVAAVVTILGLAAGGRAEVLRQVRGLGLENIIVRDPGGEGGAGRLRFGDAVALERVSSAVEAVAPRREHWGTVEAGGARTTARVVGTTPGLWITAKLLVAEGRFLTGSDRSSRRRVVVLGADVAHALFPFEAALGSWVDIGADPFEVVGVLAAREAERGGSGVVRKHDSNQEAYVPLETIAPVVEAEHRWPLDEVTVRVVGASHVESTARLVRAALERRDGEPTALEIVVPLELLDQHRAASRTFGLVLAGVAALSLLVGGIGIMNVMLATVTERTREIGIRRAVGATARDVAEQFLAEAVVLTFLGGSVGAVVGLAACGVLSALGWPIEVSPIVVATVLAVSILWGVVFGWIPAWKAAAADPIEALRYE